MPQGIKNAGLVLVNRQGQVLNTQAIRGTSNEAAVNGEALPGGVYYLLLKVNGVLLESAKIVIEH